MKKRWRAVVVTHTDLDGVAAAAIYHRGRGLEPFVDTAVLFTEPHRLPKTLKSLKPGSTERLALMDLGPNDDTIAGIYTALDRLVKSGVYVEWFDHHRWRDEWLAAVRGSGASVYIDHSTCAAGVVASRVAAGDEFSQRLAAAACAADLWRWDDPMAGRLYRVTERYRGRRGDAWRRSMLSNFYQGLLWWSELDEALMEYLAKEFESFNDALKTVKIRAAGGCRFAVALKKPGPPNASIIASGIMSRFNVDFVAIIRRRGSRGISLRSRSVDVRLVAQWLGGGGHPRAAGAPLKAPWYMRLLFTLLPGMKLKWAERLLADVLEEKGCPRLQE